MAHSSAPNETLVDVEKKEKEYDWIGASELYEKALLSDLDSAHRAGYMDRLAYSLFRASMQAQTNIEFHDKIRKAISSYETARDSYGELNDRGRQLRCEAMLAFASYWTNHDAPEKRSLIEQSWKLARDALMIFHAEQNPLEYWKTLDQLSIGPLLHGRYQENYVSYSTIVTEGLRHAEQAVQLLSKSGSIDELARAYAMASVWIGEGSMLAAHPDEQDKYQSDAIAQWTKARKLSEKAVLQQASIFAPSEPFELGSDEALSTLREVLDYARETRDRLFIGSTLDALGVNIAWKALANEDPDEHARLCNEALEYLEQAKQQFSVIAFASPALGVFSVEPHVEYYLELAKFEPDTAKKRQLLDKSHAAVPRLLKIAKESGFAWNISVAHHVASKLFESLAKIETKADARKSLLESALVHRNEAIKINEKIEPYDFWGVGLYLNYLANIKDELWHLVENPNDKKSLLEDAIRTREACSEQWSKFASQQSWQKASPFFLRMGEGEMQHAEQFSFLYDLTHDLGCLTKAVEVYEKAVILFQKSNLSTRIAECYWKLARGYQTLGDQLKARDSFARASNQYNVSSEKIPQLRDFYREYASYMDAWSLIEEARINHSEERFLEAAENYNKASVELQSTKPWNHLAKHYQACSFLEGGEALSRQERQRESKESFGAAADSFREAAEAVENTTSTPSIDKEERKNWLEIIRNRERYCRGRVQLEDARALDKDGDKAASAAKYDWASRTFDEILKGDKMESDRGELETISTFCRAWAKMKQAEIGESSEHYAQAARLFDGTTELTTKKKSRIIALANASICRALEAGSRFRLTRDTGLYAEIKKQLEIATDYYEQSGLQNSAEWTRATANTFDALVHLADAATVRENAKKTEHYHLAEKHLQLSAKLYGDAGFLAKREEALRRLKRAREDKELLLTPVEVLAGNPAFSRDSTIPPVSLVRDQASGLEKFEAASVVGNLGLSRGEVPVGSELTLELEMANVGKTVATLIKLENIMSEGVEIDPERASSYKSGQNFIDLKGKRLEYLKTHEIKIPLKAVRKGLFELRPRILFVDEKGTYRSYEFEPTSLTVRELGISGWLKGPK